MATSSFTDNVVITNSKVISTIKKALSKDKPFRKDIKPLKHEDNAKELAKIWYNR